MLLLSEAEYRVACYAGSLPLRWLTFLRFRNTARACSANRNRKATEFILIPGAGIKPAPLILFDLPVQVRLNPIIRVLSYLQHPLLEYLVHGIWHARPRKVHP